MTLKTQNQSVESIKDWNFKMPHSRLYSNICYFLSTTQISFLASWEKKKLKYLSRKAKKITQLLQKRYLPFHSILPLTQDSILPSTDVHKKTVTDFQRNKNLHTPRQKNAISLSRVEQNFSQCRNPWEQKSVLKQATCSFYLSFKEKNIPAKC